MKKILALLTLFTIALTSCSHKPSARDVLAELMSLYSIDAEIYHSGASVGEDGYIDSEMLLSLYGTEELDTLDFAVIMYGGVMKVREIAVFSAQTGSERMYLYELATDRVSFLSSFFDGEGFVKKYRGFIIYGFVDDAVGVERAFDSLL